MTTFATPEQFATAHKANVETMQTLSSSAFEKVENLTALNLNTARAVLEDGAANTKALLGAKDVQELIKLQASLAQPMVEKAVAYARSVYAIASQGQNEVSKLFAVQFADLNKAVSTALGQAAKSAPAGSEAAFAAVQSAIATANGAYDSVSKAVKQATEIAEANVAAASDATVNAVRSLKAA